MSTVIDCLNTIKAEIEQELAALKENAAKLEEVPKMIDGILEYIERAKGNKP